MLSDLAAVASSAPSKTPQLLFARLIALSMPSMTNVNLVSHGVEADHLRWLTAPNPTAYRFLMALAAFRTASSAESKCVGKFQKPWVTPA
jgi:hypothetical protein